jgi:hypothetical protein
MKTACLYLLTVCQQVCHSYLHPTTPSLVGIFNYGHSARANCHHCCEVILHPFHLFVEIAALITRESSGGPFHVL